MQGADQCTPPFAVTRGINKGNHLPLVLLSCVPTVPASHNISHLIKYSHHRGEPDTSCHSSSHRPSLYWYRGSNALLRKNETQFKNFWTKRLLLVTLCEKNKMFSAALYVSLILFMCRPTVAALSSPGSICSQCHGWSPGAVWLQTGDTLRTVLGQPTYIHSDLRSQPFSAPNDSIWRRRGTKQLNLWRNIEFYNNFNVFVFSDSRSVAGGLVCVSATLST